MLSKEYPDGQRGSFHAKSLAISNQCMGLINQRMEDTTWYKKTKEKWVSPNFWWGTLSPLGFNRFDIELDILDDL